MHNLNPKNTSVVINIAMLEISAMVVYGIANDKDVHEFLDKHEHDATLNPIDERAIKYVLTWSMSLLQPIFFPYLAYIMFMGLEKYIDGKPAISVSRIYLHT